MSFYLNSKAVRAEVVVVGAGVIGLSVALELEARGYAVTVVDRQQAMRGASWAAAGMLAAGDPHNPKELLPLARLSEALYSEYLRRIEALSGEAVPFQTSTVVEYLDGGDVVRRAERSIDPRQLAVALLAAVRARGIRVVEQVDVGEAVVVEAMGAWSAVVTPRKGQMLRVQMPEGSWLREVHRRADVYVVPRTLGPQAGTALIGATVEDVGFDVGTNAEDLERLRALAGELVPVFVDALHTPMVEAWAGLRPGTKDGLPLIGERPGRPGEFVATGHFRNGVLLAPATAVVLADLMEGRPAVVELMAFAPGRFEGR